MGKVGNGSAEVLDSVEKWKLGNHNKGSASSVCRLCGRQQTRKALNWLGDIFLHHGLRIRFVQARKAMFFRKNSQSTSVSDGRDAGSVA